MFLPLPSTCATCGLPSAVELKTHMWWMDINLKPISRFEHRARARHKFKVSFIAKKYEKDDDVDRRRGAILARNMTMIRCHYFCMARGIRRDTKYKKRNAVRRDYQFLLPYKHAVKWKINDIYLLPPHVCGIIWKRRIWRREQTGCDVKTTTTTPGGWVLHYIILLGRNFLRWFNGSNFHNIHRLQNCKCICIEYIYG